MNAYLFTEGDDHCIGSCFVVARNLEEALEAWREFAAEGQEEVPDEGFYPGSIELQHADRVLVTRTAMSVLGSPEEAWPMTSKGVTWDVCGRAP